MERFRKMKLFGPNQQNMSCNQNCNEPPSLFPKIPIPLLVQLMSHGHQHQPKQKQSSGAVIIFAALLLVLLCRPKSNGTNGQNGSSDQNGTTTPCPPCPPPEPCPPCPPIPVPETRQFEIFNEEPNETFLQMTSFDYNSNATVIGTRQTLLNNNGSSA
jgi:hypothetical protein